MRIRAIRAAYGVRRRMIARGEVPAVNRRMKRWTAGSDAFAIGSWAVMDRPLPTGRNGETLGDRPSGKAKRSATSAQTSLGIDSGAADLCRRLDRPVEARKSYARALELARQEPVRRFLERRLGELS